MADDKKSTWSKAFAEIAKQDDITGKDKTEKFKELVGKKGTKEYNEWFLSYKPGEKMEKNLTIVNKIVKPFTKKIKKYKKRAKTMKKYVLF